MNMTYVQKYVSKIFFRIKDLNTRANFFEKQLHPAYIKNDNAAAATRKKIVQHEQSQQLHQF